MNKENWKSSSVPKEQKVEKINYLFIISLWLVISCQKGATPRSGESLVNQHLTKPLTEQLIPGRKWALPDYCGKPSLRGPLAKWEIRDRFKVKIIEIIPNLYPENFGNYQFSLRHYNPLNLKGNREVETMDTRWTIKNPRVQLWWPYLTDNVYAFSEIDSFKMPDFSKMDIRVVTDPKLPSGLKMGIMTYNSLPRLSPEYTIVRKDLALGAPPKINDLLYARISADCKAYESKPIILALEPSRIISKKDSGFIEAEGYIDPVVAGRDADCVVGAAVYNEQDELYGIISSYNPEGEGLAPNYRITSVYDIRLKQLLQGYYKPNSIDFSRKDREKAVIGISDSFYQTLCDDQKLRATALQMLTSEQLKKDAGELNSAYCKNIEELQSLRSIERTRRQSLAKTDELCFKDDSKTYFELEAILKKMDQNAPNGCKKKT